MPYTPHPANTLLFQLHLPLRPSYPPDYPNEFDPLYLEKIAPPDTLSNSAISYFPDRYPLKTNQYTLLDQFTDEEFLYQENRTLVDGKIFTLYYRFNPYKQTSRLLFSISGDDSKGAKYAGYFSRTDQYCFINGKECILFHPKDKTLKVEKIFPTMLTPLRTDNESLFFFIDEYSILNAYSISQHALLWQNKDILQAFTSFKNQYAQIIEINHLAAYSGWILLSVQHNQQFVLSSSDGNVLNKFILPSQGVTFFKPYRVINGSLWIQYSDNDQSGHFQLFLENISFTKTNGIEQHIFKLGNLPLERDSTLKQVDFLPIYYFYQPNHHKLVVLFSEKESNLNPSVFGLP